MPRSPRFLIRWLHEAVSSPGVGGVLARGASAALVIRSSGLVAAFGLQVFLARLLGVAEYGIYAYALSGLSLVAMLAVFGFDGAALRFVPQYLASGEVGLLRGFVITARRSVTIASVALTLLVAVIVIFSRDRLSETESLTFGLACLAIPVIARLQLGSAILRAVKRIGAAQIPVEILRPLLTALLVLASWGLTSRDPGAPDAMGATLGANLLALAVASWWLRGTLAGEGLHGADSASLQREWLRLSLVFVGLSGFNLILSQADILMIGMLLDTTQAGIYSVASRLAALFSVGVVAVNSIAAPLFSELHSQHRRRELGRVVKLATVCLVVFGFGAATVLILGGPTMIRWFGTGFAEAYPPLVVLVGGQFIVVATGIATSFMIMTGREGRAIVVIGGLVGVNLALNAWLIPILGIVGAAWATAISLALRGAAMTWHVLRVLRAETMDVPPSVPN